MHAELVDAGIPATGDASGGGVRVVRPGYVLPLRWNDKIDPADLAELTEYLTWLADRADVVVVDGSPPDVFERHARHWCDLVRHIPVAGDLRCSVTEHDVAEAVECHGHRVG